MIPTVAPERRHLVPVAPRRRGFLRPRPCHRRWIPARRFVNSLAITDRGVAQTTAGGAITMTVASAAMSPSAGDLIAVMLTADCRNDNLSGTSDITFTITDTIGDSGGTAWSNLDGSGNSMICTRGNVGHPSYMENTQIWWRVVGTGPGVAKVVTATGLAGALGTASDGWVWGQFLEVSGQAASNPVGFSTGATSRQASGPTTYTMTMNGTAASTSALITVIHGDNTGVVATNPTGFSTLNHNEPAWGAASKSADVNPLGGGAANPQWTGLDVASDYDATCMEIKAAAGSSFIARPPLVIRQAVARASLR